MGEPPARRAGAAARAALRTLPGRIRVRQGVSRLRTSFWPVLQAALAAGVAYGLATVVLGHEQPFFAAIAAWVCLGFSFDRELRKVAEVAVGVAVGVALGDLMVHVIGSGWWQIALVMGASALIARFIDRGPLLTIQAGVQAGVVVGLPAAVATSGALGRWTDALVGGAVALLVALVTPGDPRRRIRALALEATRELALTLEALARGLRDGDADELAAALVRGRAAERVLEDWHDLATKSYEIARVSVNRVHRTEITRLAAQAVLVDRAMRSVRVLARRAPAALRSLGLLDGDDVDHRVSVVPLSGAMPAPPDVDPVADPVADLVVRYAQGVRLLAAALGSGTGLDRARDALAAVARDVDPRTLGEGHWQVQSLVLLLRSPVVDTLEASGMTPDAARATLPEM
ncbi:aromatic acid exporter family protein [Isoptericola sp. BMS4]|uniref:FUSC family protein n=1 Tax=Isoptericola sp. BMS4 TaxID=2527875 RepID=UPI00141E7163|nr:FUSC family protein [Isoptericola sp. BMS4]